MGAVGLPVRTPGRALVDACCYVLRTGCSWQLLPTSFPAWSTVYKSFSRWALQGMSEVMQDCLRAQWRERLQHDPQSSATVLDSPSTRGRLQGGASGFDADKKVKGRKRHLVVDTLGLLLAVTVTVTSVAHACTKLPTLKRLYVDGPMQADAPRHCTPPTAPKSKWEVVRHPRNRNARTFHDAEQPAPKAVPTGFVVLPKRWVVERTHAWNERCRRLVMHHDRNTLIATPLGLDCPGPFACQQARSLNLICPHPLTSTFRTDRCGSTRRVVWEGAGQY